MRHIAIVGSGPAGYYTAEAAVKQWGDQVRVDILDALPVPFGLIRSGVAPDHQSIKDVSHRYELTALADNVRFIGNVMLGRDISIADLEQLYDAVILATGAPEDRALDLPGERLGNVFGSAAFVGWYNGHPKFSALAPGFASDTAVIVGNGNVALDVARMLARSPAELVGSDIAAHALAPLSASHIRRVVILGRRGPCQIAMSPRELGELTELSRAVPRVDAADLPGADAQAGLDTTHRKALAQLGSFAAAARESGPDDVSIEFHFHAAPRALLGTDVVEGVEVERMALVDGEAVGTGETYRIRAGLVVSCIGYRTSAIAGVPYDEAGGRFANEAGRIGEGLYCVGWARRGPTGTIGTNRPDGFSVIEKVAADIGAGAGKAGRAGFDALAQQRGIDYVTFADWQKIDQAEIANARSGAPREKFTEVETMLAAASRN